MEPLSPDQYHALIRTMLGAQAVLISVSIAVVNFVQPRYRRAMRSTIEAAQAQILATDGQFGPEEMSQVTKDIEGVVRTVLRLVPVYAGAILLPLECALYTRRSLPDHVLLTFMNTVLAAFTIYLFETSRVAAVMYRERQETGTPVRRSSAAYPSDASLPTTATLKLTPVPPTATSAVAEPAVPCPYIGNRSSKKFHHHLGSSVKQMKESNKVCFQTRGEAVAAEHVACKRCNP